MRLKNQESCIENPRTQSIIHAQPVSYQWSAVFFWVDQLNDSLGIRGPHNIYIYIY